LNNLQRHPVVLYEALGYFILFLILMLLYLKFFFLEYFKTPQAEFANILPMSMGQILSLPFIIVGAILLIKGLKK